MALSEPSVGRLREALTVFPLARGGQTPSEVLDIDIDLTIVLSPPPQHLEHAEQAFSTGSHVLCEKPISDTMAAAGSMCASAAEHGRLLAIGQTRRFYPSLATARRLLADGIIGKVTRYSYTEGGAYSWPITTDAPFRRSSSGGGVLLDKGVHAVDILCWLFGAAEVVANRDDACGDGTECFSQTTLLHGHVAGSLTLAWDQELTNSCLVEGELGDLWFPNGSMHDLFHRGKGGAWRRAPLTVDFAADIRALKRRRPRVYYECFELQLVQVLRAIIYGEPVPVDGEEALVGLKVINAAYSISTPFIQSWLPENERAEACRRHWRQGN